MLKKKVLSGLLALALVFGSAAALPEGVFDTNAGITASAVSTATSGTCGENLTWTLSDGVLTISGTGAMTNYKNNESPFYGRTDIQSVYIKSGVTSIGDHAFTSCKNLVSISIKSTVVRIGMAAFSGCKALMDISIPSSVKYIDDSAFSGCTTLTSVDIPASVESIGEHAFYGCTNLASITIPNGLTNIGGWAFLETKWLENEQKKNPLVVVNGMLIDARTYKGELTVPSNVERIGNAAFGGNNDLTAVTIPNSVTNIGNYAFEDCDNLISATLPNGITFIPSGLFRLCDNLKTVNIPDSVDMIYPQAFYGCKSLESITLPDGVEVIDTGAFYCCYKLEDINIPSSVKFIETWAFENCPNLTSLTIPSSVERIGNDAIDKKCTIICEKGSKAEKYAKDNGLKIEYIGVTHVAAKAATCTADGNIEYWKHDGKFYSDAKLTTEITQAKTVVKATGHKFSAWKTTAFDVAKGTSTQTRKCSSCGNTETQTTKNAVSRFAGAGRYETAAKISQAEFTQADTVVLANSMNYADALAGVPLAKAKNAPILLTNKGTLDKATLAEIKRLKAKNVIILGGKGAISEQVENTLKKEGLKTERFEGETRYGTATAIAEKLSEKPTDIFFVFGGNYPDALSASAAAAAKNAPIIYLTKDGELNADTAKYLAKLKKAGSVKNAYVIGGDGVISDVMMNKAGTALGLTPTRVFGADRFATCVAVNEKFANVLNGNSVCVATGMDFPDALAGGVFAAINNAPLFLVNGKQNPLKLSDLQKSFLGKKTPQKLYVFGGTGVVSDSHVQTVADACV